MMTDTHDPLDKTHFVLDEEQFDVFFTLLKSPEPVNNLLVKLLKRKPRWLE